MFGGGVAGSLTSKHKAACPIALPQHCRLDLAERIRAPNRGPARRNPFEAAMAEAQRAEREHGPPEELPFGATIMCVGITGVGKTATIHSLLGLPPPSSAGFGPETKQVCCAIECALPRNQHLGHVMQQQHAYGPGIHVPAV